MRYAFVLGYSTVVLAICSLAGCPTPQPVPPQPDADAAPAPPVVSDAATACVAACNTMAALGCSEGRSVTCAISMQKVETDRLIRLPSGQPMTCAVCMLAKGAADVRNLCASSCSP